MANPLKKTLSKNLSQMKVCTTAKSKLVVVDELYLTWYCFFAVHETEIT